MLRVEVTADPSYSDLPTKIAILNNNIAKGYYNLAKYITIEMLESDKTAYGNEWCIYRERNSNLGKHRGKTYSLTLVQCTQFFQDNMNQYPSWNATSI